MTDGFTLLKQAPDEWPNTGALNTWYVGASCFTKLVAENPGFWCFDSDLKYLDIRIDTRNDRFVLFTDRKERISPDRVTAAIKLMREKWS